MVKKHTDKLVLEKTEHMNAVIAKYMGYKSSPDQSEFVKTNKNGINEYRHKSDLKYNISMDMLYPVWRKLLYEDCSLLPFRETTALIGLEFSLALPISKIHESIFEAILLLKNK